MIQVQKRLTRSAALLSRWRVSVDENQSVPSGVPSAKTMGMVGCAARSCATMGPVLRLISSAFMFQLQSMMNAAASMVSSHIPIPRSMCPDPLKPKFYKGGQDRTVQDRTTHDRTFKVQQLHVRRTSAQRSKPGIQQVRKESATQGGTTGAPPTPPTPPLALELDSPAPCG